MRNLIVGLVLSFWCFAAEAQEITILDEITRDPVEHVQLDVQGKKLKRLYTDSLGKVTVFGGDKSDTLILNHINYGESLIPYKSLRKSDFIVLLEQKFIEYPAIDIKSSREQAVSTPQKVKTLSQEQIRYEAPANAAALLESTGQVLVQRSQQGGGSPIIRGFEANRVLLVIDGVRMNNAIYRSGHLQNAITVDNNILDNTEIIFGTSSLIYGSDALGGVVHYHTIDPKFSDSIRFDLSTSLKYASAAQENAAHAHFQIRGKKVSSLTSFSYSDFGDLRMGANRIHDDEEWGLVREFVDRVDGQDIVRTNSNPLIQKKSAYHQYDFTQKLKFKLSDKNLLRANLQYSSTSDIPRFDQFNDIRNGTLRFAEWFYGPQQRFLFSLGTDIFPKKQWSDKVSITAAYQRIDEDRITRNFGDNQRFTREEDVTVLSLNADMVKTFEKDKKLFYGVEITNNDVLSSAFTQDIITNEIGDGLTRYPNGGSQLSTAAVYASYLNNFKPKWQYNLGARYNTIQSDSKFESNPFFELPFESISLTNSALTGSAGLKYNHSDSLQLRLLTSSGFRAPNVDDYGKVFDRDGFVVVPDDRIEPEYALNGEVGVLKSFFDTKLKFDVSLFYTHILDAIVQRDFTLNGADSLSLEGEVSRIQSNQNASEARVYGYGIGLEYKIAKNWGFDAFANYTVGEVVENNEPLAHIPPFFMKAELKYKKDKVVSSFYLNYHDIKTRSLIAPGRTDNPSEGSNGQFPSWYTLNWRMSYDLTKSLTAQVALENILDQHYKVFASGLSSPGRNFVLVIRADI